MTKMNAAMRAAAARAAGEGVENAAICCENLSLLNSSKTILGGISLAIPKGAVVGVVGRNGAGKSTLLRCMVGLTAPDFGWASLFGCPSLELDDSIRARLGYVAQSPDLFGWMSVIEHLRTISSAYPNWDEERCRLLAARLDLPMLDRVSQLSGGDQQKLSVILALAHNPDVLILDEPVSNLDPITRRDFMRSLFLDQREGNESSATAAPTVVISSHLLTDLERVISHVAFIREGYLQLFDTWDAILECVRVVPRETEAPAAALLYQNRQHSVIDTRAAPQLQDAGSAVTLDQIFSELNA
ncbi:MAG TPA: ABC transporter ATP-binding protein [Burkholderiaceae bacterium]